MKMNLSRALIFFWVLFLLAGFLLVSEEAFCFSGNDLEALERQCVASREMLVDSFERGDVEGFSAELQRVLESGLTDSPLAGEITEYVVLAPNRRYAEGLSRFRNIKEREGFAVFIHDLEQELGGSATDPHAIRAFLRDRYLDGSLRYLMIVGHHELIPMLEAYSLTSWRMHTDMYYADLEGDWDSDQDGIYGEMCDDDLDFIPEFICTRIPCRDLSEGAFALENALRYQHSSSPEKDTGILMAGTIAVEGESGLLQNIIAILLGLKNFTTTRMFDTDTFRWNSVEVPLNPDYLLYDTPVPDVWNTGRQGFVFDISHGSHQGVAGFSIEEVSDLDLDVHGHFVAAACAICPPLLLSRNFAEELLFTGGLGGVIGSTDIVNPGEGLRVISGIFAEVGFVMAATRPDLSMGQAMNTIKVLYYLLFVANEQDPYWLEMKAQNLKGYTFMGEGSGSLRDSG